MNTAAAVGRRRAGACRHGHWDRRTVLAGGSAACLLAAGALVWFGGPAWALAPDRTAWWNTVPVTTPTSAPASLPTAPTTPVTAPSTIGPNELEVSFTGTGTAAFAAVQYTVPLQVATGTIDPSTLTATMTLTLDTANSTGTPAVVACPTTTPWSAGGDQQAATAPATDCSGDALAKGTVDATNHTVSFSLGAAQEESYDPGVFAVAILPDPSATQPFQAVFDGPGDQSFTVTGEQVEPTTTTTTAVPAGNGGGAGSSGLGSDQGGGGVFALAPPFEAPGALAPAAPVATPSEPTTGVSPGARVPLALGARPAARQGMSPSVQRAVAVVVLVLLGVGLAAAAGREQRAPRSLRPVHLTPAGGHPPA